MKMMKIAALVMGAVGASSNPGDILFPFKNPQGSKFRDGHAPLSEWSSFQMHCYHFLWSSVGDPSKNSKDAISKKVRNLCVQDNDTCESLTAGIMNAVDAKMSKSRKRPYNDWCQAIFEKQGGVLSKHAEAIEADETTPAPKKQQPLLKASVRQPEEHDSKVERAKVEPEAQARAQAREEATQSALRKAIVQTASADGSSFELTTSIEGVAIAEKATNLSPAVGSEMDSAEDSLDKALGAAKKISKKHKRHRRYA